MKIVVTGSHGFIGSWLCRYLSIPEDRQFDLLNWRDLTEGQFQAHASGFENSVIVCLHSISGVSECLKNQELAKKVNTESVVSLAELSKKQGVRRFIFASSSAVYGEPEAYLIDELHPRNPRSLYGKTKEEAETGLLQLADDNFEVVILRKSNVYGWGLKWKQTVLDQFIDNYLALSPIEIQGTGQQKRDFLDVHDAARLYCLAAMAKHVRSGVYNAGGNEVLSIRALAELVNEIGEHTIGHRAPVILTGEDTGGRWHDFKYDTSKVRMELRWQPHFTTTDHIKARLKHSIRKQQD